MLGNNIKIHMPRYLYLTIYLHLYSIRKQLTIIQMHFILIGKLLCLNVNVNVKIQYEWKAHQLSRLSRLDEAIFVNAITAAMKRPKSTQPENVRDNSLIYQNLNSND